MITVTRKEALEHIASINSIGPGSGARASFAEMIAECDAAIRDGHAVWRDDVAFPGRFLTDAGRTALASM